MFYVVFGWTNGVTAWMGEWEDLCLHTVNKIYAFYFSLKDYQWCTHKIYVFYLNTLNITLQQWMHEIRLVMFGSDGADREQNICILFLSQRLPMMST